MDAAIQETIVAPLNAARAAFLEAGKPSMSIRQRSVLPRDDLDERLKAAIEAYDRHR